VKIVHIVKEVVIHSYREDFSTSLSIWVYGEIRLSARDMASPSQRITIFNGQIPSRDST
jgi:hypothetical protein